MKKFLALILFALSACGGSNFDYYNYAYEYNDVTFYVFSETEAGANQQQVEDWTRRTFAAWPECLGTFYGGVEIGFVSTKIIPGEFVDGEEIVAGITKVYENGWTEIRIGNWHYVDRIFYHELTHAILIYCGIESSEENVESRHMVE